MRRRGTSWARAAIGEDELDALEAHLRRLLPGVGYSTAMPATRAQIRNSRSASSWYSASVGSLRKST